MHEILRRIGNFGVVPVIALPDADTAEPLAQALRLGGLPLAEVTFRTEAAAEGIARMKRAEPEMLVGAGTVISVEQAGAAIAAGAEFIVAPGFDAELVDWCLERAVPVMPGIATASELTQAVRRGIPVVKCFPAEAMGGMKTIKALGGPFPEVLFMATGGIHIGNLASYLTWERMLAVGGSWMVARQMLADGRFGEVTAQAAQSVRLAAGARAGRKW